MVSVERDKSGRGSLTLLLCFTMLVLSGCGGGASTRAGSPVPSTDPQAESAVVISTVPIPNAVLHSLACATGTTCVAVGKSNGHGAIAVHSTDAGTSWVAGEIPQGLSDIRIVTCSDVDRCIAAGMTVDGIETLLRSDDAGGHWRESPAIGDGRVDALDCDGSLCMALLADVEKLHVKSSTNAGQTWTEARLPAPATVGQGLWCFPDGECWVSVGDGAGQLFVTTDAGQTWSSRMPTSSTGLILAVACVDTERCWAGGQSFPSIVRSGDGGATWSGEAVPESIIAVRALSCSRQICLATADDGRSRERVLLTRGMTASQVWQEQTLPGGRSINALHCGSDSRCIAVGDGLALTFRVRIDPT